MDAKFFLTLKDNPSGQKFLTFRKVKSALTTYQMHRLNGLIPSQEKDMESAVIKNDAVTEVVKLQVNVEKENYTLTEADRTFLTYISQYAMGTCHNDGTNKRKFEEDAFFEQNDYSQKQLRTLYDDQSDRSSDDYQN